MKTGILERTPALFTLTTYTTSSIKPFIYDHDSDGISAGPLVLPDA